MNKRFAPCLAVLGLACAPVFAAAPAPPAPGFDLKRPEIVHFINDLAERDGMSRHELRALLRQAQPQQKILDLMNRPLEKVAPWWEYRERFLTSERINLGALFWADHKEALERIAAAYQVPPEYLVAIIGVETFYGRQTGRFRVLDALATLAFDYPPRGNYFRAELEQFLLLAREDKLDPLTTLGSYAGAMGVPQFMPSAYRRFAVDADSDRKRDLWGDWDDIFASIANYLKVYGWVPGAPVLAEVHLDPDPTFQIEPHNLELNETLDGLAAHGVKVEGDLPGGTAVVLVSAEQHDGPAYRVGFRNFYVITRYNNSARYGMAVYDLAKAVAQRVHGDRK
ncbi:MAG: lytic murein transglycosylase B [Steroidobacteraceae bacterium]